MRTAKRHVWVAGIVVLVGGADAFAHGLAYYLSTPVSPPVHFQWVAYVSIPLLVVLNAALLIFLMRKPWWKALLQTGLAVGVFAAAFFFFGESHTRTSTGPEPGLNWGYPVFWGLGWNELGGLFIGWNFLGLLFLAGSVLLFAIGRKRIRTREAAIVLSANAILYSVCLLPYIVTGAFAHGWAGGYVQRACVRQLCDIGLAVRTYAHDHEERLPPGRTMEEVFAEISPYLREKYNWQGHPVCVCRVGGAFDAQPKAYVWNSAFSGSTLAALRELKPPEPLLICPYKHGSYSWYDWDNVIYTEDILQTNVPEERASVSPEYARTLMGKLDIEDIAEWENKLDAIVRTRYPLHQTTDRIRE